MVAKVLPIAYTLTHEKKKINKWRAKQKSKIRKSDFGLICINVNIIEHTFIHA